MSLIHPLSETVREQVTHPELWSSLKKRYANVRVSHYTYGQLARIEGETGLRTLGQVVDFLVEGRRENVLPASFDLVFCDDRPICLTGPSGSGKSCFVKSKLLPSVTGPVFLVDLASEYHQLRRVDLSSFFQVRWQQADETTRIRLTPNSNPAIAQAELRMVFDRLATVKTTEHSPEKFPSGALSRWTLIIEEGHRLARETSFTDFLQESRKFLRKLVIISSDPSLYGHICRTLKPPPLEELLADLPKGDVKGGD